MTNDKDGAALLPCPFCESDTAQTAEFRWNPVMSRWAVFCVRGCEVQGPPADTEAEAIAAWNRRAALKSHGQAFDAAGVREAVEHHFPEGIWAQPCGNRALSCGCGEVLWGVDSAACKAAWSLHIEQTFPIPEAPASVEPVEYETLIAAGFDDYAARCALRTDPDGVFCHAYFYSDGRWRFQTGGNDLTLPDGTILRCVLTKRLYARPEPDTIGSHFGNGGGLDPVGKGPCAVCGGGEGYCQHGPFNDDWHKYQPSPSFGGGDLREAVAVALWKREAERAAPNVAKGRNAVTFHDQLECEKEKWLGLADAALAALPPVKQSVGFYYPIEMPLDADGNGPATIGKDATRMTYQVWDQLCDSHGDFDLLADAIRHANNLNAALSHDQRGGAGE